MKVVSYLNTVPANNKKQEKTDILKFFHQGVIATGDQSVLHNGFNVVDCDVAVIQGWVHENSKISTHLNFRKEIINHQKKIGKRVLIADSNLFLYANNKNPLHYLRYSFDGVFPTTGEYFWNNSDPTRWNQISKDLKIDLKDWRKTGNHILICTQRNGGWSMKGLNVINWLEQTVDQIKKYSNRPIVVRGHPGDNKSKNYLKSVPNRYTISNNDNILDDFKNAWCVITYNSSPGVAASIEGIPAFITDPAPETSQAYPVGNYDISKIENPDLKDRQEWIEKLSMCHWNFHELANGSAWQHIKKYI